MPLYSEVTYTATGGQTNFNITFEVLKPEWVYVSLDDVAQNQGDYVIDVGQSEMRWGGSSISAGVKVRIFRSTPVALTDEVVEWTGGPASDEDFQLDQTKYRHHIQELTDVLTQYDDLISLKAAGPTMMTLALDDGGVNPGMANGYNWGVPVDEGWNTGRELRVKIKEGDGYEPQENNNIEGDIEYLSLADYPGGSEPYSVRLKRGKYLIEAHATFYCAGSAGAERRAEWEPGLQFSIDGGSTWNAFTGKFQTSDMLTHASVDLNPWQLAIPHSFSAILDVADQDFNDVALVAHDNDASATRESGVIGGYLTVTKLGNPITP